MAALAQHQRADAMRIAESDQAQAQHHADHRIAALAATVHAGHRADGGFRAELALLFQFISEHVQQHFAVRIGIDVAAVLLEHLLAQVLGVDQVAVVGQRDAVRRIDVERLCLVHAFRASGRVAHMGDTDTAFQGGHGACIEDIADQASSLLHPQAAAVDGGDARRVLAAMLEDGQAVIQLPGDVLVADDSDDATHDARSPLGCAQLQGRWPYLARVVAASAIDIGRVVRLDAAR
ncbi:hypothetical protein D3C73_1106780 [compost metagenome]